ncbi:PspA/IM30 family protein, partial [Bacillus sp. SIMBA_069]
DKARLFLKKKATLAEKEVQLQAAYQAAASNVTGMRQIEEKLRADIGELEGRRTKLKEKIAATKAQQSLNSLGSPMGDVENAFDAVEEKVDKAYNEAIAITELRTEAKDDFD